jgi:hypothetical protein
VSHLKERNEKECLNCNAIIYGRFCHVCGQENLIPKEPFLHLVTHFIYDIIHFDGKFFDTLKYLLLRPGFLAYEYMRGRRNSYLNPIRMYIFTSAIFFLIYFSVNKSEEHKTTAKHSPPTKETLIKNTASKQNNSEFKYQFKVDPSVFDSAKALREILQDSIDRTKDIKIKNKLQVQQNLLKKVEAVGKKIANESDEYDSAFEIEYYQDTSKKRLVTKERNIQIGSFFERIFKDKKLIQAKIPQVMFVTLPLMALILQLLYGRLKQFFYVNHVIFIINLYTGVYLIILLEMWFSYLNKISHFGLFGFFASLLSLGTFFYTYKSLRNFYLQGSVKTLFKCFLLFTLFSIIAILTHILVAAIPFSVSH